MLNILITSSSRLLRSVALSHWQRQHSMSKLRYRLQYSTFDWLRFRKQNKLDHNRISKVGPDRACAEWLLRVGATIKFHGQDEWIKDTSQLEQLILDDNDPRLQAMHAYQATAMVYKSFEYFKNVNHLEKMTFINCKNFDIISIQEIVHYLAWTVEELEINDCEQIQGEQVTNIYMQRLKALKSLKLIDLNVSDPAYTYRHLVNFMPHCCRIEIDTKDGYHNIKEPVPVDMFL